MESAVIDQMLAEVGDSIRFASFGYSAICLRVLSPSAAAFHLVRIAILSWGKGHR